MNRQDELLGKLRFGRGLSAGGVPFTIKLEPGQLPDRGLRPEDDVGKKEQGETGKLKRDPIKIRILAGRDGAKYTWKRVHPHVNGAGNSIEGGSTKDGFYALEMNGRRDVPTNYIVEATYSDVGPWLDFSYQGQGGSGSGPGGLTTVRWHYYTKIGESCYFVEAALTTGANGEATIAFDLEYDGDGP